jgi:phosphotriesterase-related protein
MPTVMTVLGPIDATALGKTITHEHLFIDLSCYLTPPMPGTNAEVYHEPVSISNLHSLHRDPYGNRDNCILDDVDLATREVMTFKEQGGKTIVDVTLVDIGRDPLALAEVSKRTGVNIIAGCGHYIYSAFPPGVAEMSEQQLTDELLREIQLGIAETGIKPGVIGEIGTGHPIHAAEARMLRAAARAQIETGLAISIHVHPPGRRGHEVLDILLNEGVKPERLILGHLDASLAHLDIEFDEAIGYVESLADRGAYIEFDLCGNSGYFVTKEASWWLPSDRERAKAIEILCRKGFKSKILLSQDVGHKHYLKEFGGWGYGHVLRDFRHHLREAGVESSSIEDFFVANPAQAIASEV